MKRKQFLSLALAGAMAASCLAGCGGSAGSEAGSQAADSTAGAATTETATGEPVQASYPLAEGDKTITV